MKVVFVGAGVASCIVARALAGMAGVDVLCLEQVMKGDHSESGTGLNIGPNAIKALHLHDPQLHDAVLARSFPWKSWKVWLADGTPVFQLPLAEVADNVGVRIRWSELYSVLRGDIAGVIRYGARVSRAGYDCGSRERLFVEYTENGTTQRIDHIDLLVAGDGRYSLVREQLTGRPTIKQHGVVICRLLVPDTSGGLIDDYEQWFNGPNRLLAFRVPDDAIYIAATFPNPVGASIPAAARDPGSLRDMYTPPDALPCAACRWIIKQLCGNVSMIHWARFQESPPLYADANGHGLFLGDAAHGMVPTLGQGATQAIEDACTAGSLLRRQSGNSAVTAATLPALLQHYAQLREARIRFVIDLSNEATDTIRGSAEPVAGSLTKLELPFLQKLRQLYRDVTVVHS
jgi:salicylate hydroxylase